MARREFQTLFPIGSPPVTPLRIGQDDPAVREQASVALRSQLLNREHTNEIYGARTSTMADAIGMMPTPDAVASRFAMGKGYRIYEEMQRNVLFYGALMRGRIDLMMSLKQVWIAGQKGNTESEAAKEAVQSAWENIDERHTAMHGLAGGIETGFAPAENIFDVHTRGKAKGLIAPVAIIDRPVNWFRFDWLGNPYFRPEHYMGQGGPVSDYKVSFLRYGSLHTKYGRGEGQDCYQAVYAINTINRFGLDAFERFGYPIAVIVYPRDWTKEQKAELEFSIWRTYKNYLSYPGDVTKPEISFPAQEKVSTGAFGDAHRQIIEQFCYWLSMRLWGSMLSVASSAKGSFARDQVHDAIRLEKAAGDASAMEACINRGFVKPIMLANYPQLEESLWPRLSIDASPDSDLKALLDIATAADKLGFPVSRAWFSETFSLPVAQDDADTLHAAQPAVLAPGQMPPHQVLGPNGQPVNAQYNAIDGAKRNMSEAQAMIAVCDTDGNVLRFATNEMVLTENRGAIRASKLESNDLLVVTRRMLRSQAA